MLIFSQRLDEANGCTAIPSFEGGPGGMLELSLIVFYLRQSFKPMPKPKPSNLSADRDWAACW